MDQSIFHPSSIAISPSIFSPCFFFSLLLLEERQVFVYVKEERERERKKERKKEGNDCLGHLVYK